MQPEKPSPATDLKARVLVVDDEVNARNALVELLRDDGYTVEAAADALKALGQAAHFAPDLLLTDLKMPGMDGLALIARLRKDHPGLPAIVMTAFGEGATVLRALRSGASDCLAKPINLKELSLAIERALGRRPSR